MVTNTAGSATEIQTVKENGDCKKDDKISDENANLKQTSDNSLRPDPVDKLSNLQQNDCEKTMSSAQAEMNEESGFHQTSSAGNGSCSARGYGNGLSAPPTANVNGPHNVSYPGYGNYNHNSAGYSGKPMPGTMQSNHNNMGYSSSLQPRYPANQQLGTTPTLNQLLAAPSRNMQYPGYGSQSNHQAHGEYGQSQQSWPPKSQHDRSSMEGQPKANNFLNQQAQYSTTQQPSNYPGHYPRYSSTAGNPGQYAQQSNNMIPSGQAGYPPNVPQTSRHPGYPGYQNYANVQQGPFYGQRPPHTGYETQQNIQSQASTDKMYQHSKDAMMSTQGATQSTANAVPVPSPLDASSLPPSGHTNLGHFRNPSSGPGSPAVAAQARGTPLSPTSVRSDTSQHPMRPGSSHSEHSNPPVPSPMSGASYGAYRPHSSQSFGWQPPNYPQHMMSPQHQPSYSSSQQHPNSNHLQTAANMRPSGPPSVGKPAYSGSQAYSQSQPSPGYSQSGGHMHYYDNVPQSSHFVQGYASASPAPAERRPSRQGSIPPVAHTPEPAARQGAAAAAAAALAAAAHSAQPGSVPGPKAQAPGFYPQQAARHQHPNYNNMQHQSMEMGQQNMNYPRMPHPGGPPNRMMGPSSMGPHENYRMPPPSHYQPGYGQQAMVPQQGGQYPPGYYPTGPGDAIHPHGPRPPYSTQNYPKPPRVHEEPPKKPSARSASQKLAALFEPDEPGRREFIEGVIRYWEEKDVPLKNAPLMGRKTLDLFRLYHVVKERGGMQEVTNGKKWSEISTFLGMGNASSSGFTLKKQYCKYLYGYECKVDKGIPEPQEAMARITEANRKRKQAHDNSKDDSQRLPAGPMMHAHPVNVPGGQGYPPQYPPGQYPPQQHYQVPPSHSAPSYMMHPNPVQANTYSQHPGHGAPPQPLPPQMPQVPHPSAPPSINASRPWLQPAPGPTQSQPPHPMFESADIPRKEVTAASGTVPEPVASAVQDVAPVTSANQEPNSIKPPILLAANPFSETSQRSSPSLPPASSYPETQQNYVQRPMQDQHRLPFPPPSVQVATSYPYSNSPVPHPSPLRAPTHSVEIRATPSPGPRTSYQPSPPMSTRPTHPTMALNSYSSPSTASPYPGMKRASVDSFGPPRKYIRQETPQPLPPNHPSYRPGMEAMRHRHPTDSPLAGPYRPPGPGGTLSSQVRLHPSYPHYRFPRYMSDKSNRNQPYAVARSQALKQRLVQKYPHDPRPNLKRQLQMPHSHQSKREMVLFPPDSVEATHVKMVKYQRKTCHDVGLTESWRLIMSLKSGLLVESAWAFNTLNVLLFDQRSVAQFRLNQLPGLLDSVVEHYRRCLAEVFVLPSELSALGLPTWGTVEHEEVEASASEELNTINKAKLSRKKKKPTTAVSKFKSKFTSIKIKVEPRSEAFLLDNTDQWDASNHVKLADDLSHIIVSLSANLEPRAKQKKKDEKFDEVGCVEATLEDVLSIPCSVLSPDDKILSINPIDHLVAIDGDFDLHEETLETVNDSAVAASKSDDQPEDASTAPEKDSSETKTLTAHHADAKPATNKDDEIPNNPNSVDPKSKVHSSLLPTSNGLRSNQLHASEPNKDGSSLEPTLKPPSEERDFILQADIPEKSYLSQLCVTDTVKKVLRERNVILVEDEVVGSDGSGRGVISGPIFCSKFNEHRNEVVNRLIAVSNTLRSLSFIPSNVEEFIKQRPLMKALSGVLLLRHKHRLRSKRDIAIPKENESLFAPKKKEDLELDSHTEVVDKCPLLNKKTGKKSNCARTTRRRSSRSSRRKSSPTPPEEEDVKALEENVPKLSDEKKLPKKCLFSSTVLNEDEDTYKDSWWWDGARRMREDALVILANVASSLDLSVLPDDNVPLAILEACLHWVVCPSSDAHDAFSNKSRDPLSAQRLAVEILTKLSIKDQNVDLILATRPFSRIEKLFNYLVTAVGDRRDQVSRELAIVLLSNLSRGGQLAARAIALQPASISSLINFLEECEETGLSNRQRYGQHDINCGKPPYMMAKAAKTLLAMAVVEENKPSFIKYQLRLLSLSMSQYLGHHVTSIISSLLFELTHDST